ncbi:MAG: hypothetical protein JW969_18490 [Spirochaetales bacterium]|nr:hypothetical protein [Spirochaetales bacterium]
MLGIIYIIASIVIGYFILKKTLSGFLDLSKTANLFDQQVKVPVWFVMLPASFLVGTLVCTWFTYIVSYVFYPTGAPMLWGNIIFFVVFAGLTGVIIYLKRTEILRKIIPTEPITGHVLAFLKKYWVELSYIVVILVVWTFFVFRSFNVSNGTMNVGVTVFSDFAPHLAVIRSFSRGLNFPSEYPHFADGTMRYHFMFQFLVGNLEYLGLQIDWAFNLPSIFSMLSFLMLLFAFVMSLFGKRVVAIMTAVLFFFRSSFAIFTYIFNINIYLTFTPRFNFIFNWQPRFHTFAQFWDSFWNNKDHIGNTEHEIWGLYAQKVYVNQRHLPFALGFLFLILILLYPLFKRMLDSLKNAGMQVKMKKMQYLAEMAKRAQEEQNDIFSENTPPELKINEPIDIAVDGSAEPLETYSTGEKVEDETPPIPEETDSTGETMDEQEQPSLSGGTLDESIGSDDSITTETAVEGAVPDIIPSAFAETVKKPRKKRFFPVYLFHIWKEFIWSLDAWLPENKLRPVILGVLLGLLGFWNGAVVVITLALLFMMALYSKNRLEYFTVALIVTLLVIVESAFFVGSGESVVSPQFTWGYLARDKSIWGVMAFYIELLGILPFMVIASLFVLPKGGRVLTLIFFIPIVIANTLQLTPDISVNHKYVIIGVILLNIPVAYFIYRLFKTRLVVIRIVTAFLVLLMVATGVQDLITQYNMDKGSINHPLHDPMVAWLDKNTGPNEIFLTEMYSTHPILLAGRKIFYGWPYYPWSAGYKTDERKSIRKLIYEGAPNAKELIEEYNIKYIVIDMDNRTTSDYVLNEDFIRDNFKLVYEDKNRPIAIYRTY